MIELVVVIVILGVIASIAVPRMSKAAETARTNTLNAQLAQYTRAFEVYHAEHLAWPPDSAVGVAPPVMHPYLDPEAFSRETVIGGKWDWQNNGGDDVQVRIISPNAKALAAMKAVSQTLDATSDLSSGKVKLGADIFSFDLGR